MKNYNNQITSYTPVVYLVGHVGVHAEVDEVLYDVHGLAHHRLVQGRLTLLGQHENMDPVLVNLYNQSV